MKVPLDIVGGTSFDRYTKQSIENTYNMIISDGALVPFAGYKKQVTFTEGFAVARELYRSVKRNHLMAVIGDTVYWIDQGLTFAEVGTLSSGGGNVFIAENNNNEIAIVDGINIYVFNTQTELFKIVPNIEFKPIYIEFQDGYLIAAGGGEQQWYLSGLNDAFAWPNSQDPDDPLINNIGELETKPDTMVATVRFNRQLFIMGTKTTEIWHNVGAPLFPYQRDNSISLDYGCLQAATIATGFDLLVWLAVNEKAGPTIRYSAGGPVKELSTDGINFKLDDLKEPENSTAFLFEQDGHVFYVISFLGEDDSVTYAYDFNTDKFFTITDEKQSRHIAKRTAFFNNTQYFVSVFDGSLYELSSKFNTFIYSLDAAQKLDEEEIPRIRVTKNYRQDFAERFDAKRLSLTMRQGNAFPLTFPTDTNTQEEQVTTLSISRDGGSSFGPIVRNKLRPIPHRANRMDFWQLGSANDMVFQLRFWGRTPTVVLNGQLEV